MNQASFSVYLNRKTGDVLLSKQFPDKNGLHCDTGQFLRLARKDVKSVVLQFAEAHFVEFESRLSDESSELQRMSSHDRKEFYKAHKHVWVCRKKPEEVVISPWRLARRGKEMALIALDPEDNVHVPWPTTGETFLHGLMTALDRAQ